MGLLKSSSNRRLSLAKLRGSTSGMSPGRASPAPPQIITSTPNPSSSELHEQGKSDSQTDGDPPSHVALSIPTQDQPTSQSLNELRRAAGAVRNYDSPFQNLQAAQHTQEDSQLLGVHPAPPNDRLRRARKAASHSDLNSASHISGSLSTPAGLHPSAHPSRPNSIAPSIYSGVPPSSFKDLAVLYQVVAERRTAFDNLLWQVPATSLTAHAFLFSISLAADTGRFARIASMGLCIVITVLTLHLFTRQLQAEDADHRWLADFEERHQIEYYDRAHGDRWRDYRAQKPAGAGKLGWLAMHRSYPLWSKGMLIIGFLAVAILILAIFHPTALLGYNCELR
ncbi:hypothetical protein PTTG_09891 [Puccinia triticina 1-1 BBBD Race 1]|uniref:Uncharacterized protein n=2 Tax=Puccinia triticina TaxID=208348 RepID=A0A180GG77_PUCT1|nr:uncharacterized protein PtA15_5A874 [Puccinia triticina]OAV91621.1 hypothetical protein PTTG_09891 [Puccinia triticina 1-1 BBBD Race 1]WAQ85299.1 hypothetical protein PtA15_5A874 [Puccinia triticina]WAR58596.1 hypothetical protein PtB15_5B830 [Puccinia triticina]